MLQEFWEYRSKTIARNPTFRIACPVTIDQYLAQAKMKISGTDLKHHSTVDHPSNWRHETLALCHKVLYLLSVAHVTFSDLKLRPELRNFCHQSFRFFVLQPTPRSQDDVLRAMSHQPLGQASSQSSRSTAKQVGCIGPKTSGPCLLRHCLFGTSVSQRSRSSHGWILARH